MPIELYVGYQGDGKTYCMAVEAILPALADPRWIVLSNMTITHPNGRKPIPVAPSGRSLDFDLIMAVVKRNHDLPKQERKNILIAIDEVSSAIPQELRFDVRALDVIALCNQMRKNHVDFVGTIQIFERAFKPLRDATNLVHVCRMFSRDWRWWHRDVDGPLNRRTGKPFKLAWLFEIESITPDGLRYLPGTIARKKAQRGGFHKRRFTRKNAACFETDEIITATTIKFRQPQHAYVDEVDTEEMATIAEHVTSQHFAQLSENKEELAHLKEAMKH